MVCLVFTTIWIKDYFIENSSKPSLFLYKWIENSSKIPLWSACCQRMIRRSTLPYEQQSERENSRSYESGFLLPFHLLLSIFLLLLMAFLKKLIWLMKVYVDNLLPVTRALSFKLKTGDSLVVSLSSNY